jgi:hypothetical protein
MLEIFDDVVIDEPGFGLVNPILIVDCSRARVRNQFAIDRVGDEILLSKIFDAIVCVASNGDDDRRLEDCDGLAEVVETNCVHLGLCFSLNMRIFFSFH